MSFKDAVKSLVNDIENAASDFFDEAARGFNAANPNCSCSSPPPQSLPEEDNKGSNNSLQKNSGGQKGPKKGGALRRPYVRKGTRQGAEANAKRAPDGRPIDPNTHEPIDGKPDLGHKAGSENWREAQQGEAEGLSQKEFNDRMNDPDKYQLEDPSSNRSHQYEQPREPQPEKKPPS